MQCAERIRALREDHDYTQDFIATILHVAQTTYSDYEKGKVRIPLVIIPLRWKRLSGKPEISSPAVGNHF